MLTLAINSTMQIKFCFHACGISTTTADRQMHIETGPILQMEKRKSVSRRFLHRALLAVVLLATGAAGYYLVTGDLQLLQSSEAVGSLAPANSPVRPTLSTKSPASAAQILSTHAPSASELAYRCTAAIPSHSCFGSCAQPHGSVTSESACTT